MFGSVYRSCLSSHHCDLYYVGMVVSFSSTDPTIYPYRRQCLVLCYICPPRLFPPSFTPRRTLELIKWRIFAAWLKYIGSCHLCRSDKKNSRFRYSNMSLCCLANSEVGMAWITFDSGNDIRDKAVKLASNSGSRTWTKESWVQGRS